MTSSPADLDAARRSLQRAGELIVATVNEHCASYLVARARAIVDAWRAVGGSVPSTIEGDLMQAAEQAAARTAAELEALFACAPADQRATPLQVIRRAVREPSAVLAAARIPDVERDEFATASFPDDPYDLTPRSLTDFDEDAGAAVLAWGVAKAQVLRAQHRLPGPE